MNQPLSFRQNPTTPSLEWRNQESSQSNLQNYANSIFQAIMSGNPSLFPEGLQDPIIQLQFIGDLLGSHEIAQTTNRAHQDGNNVIIDFTNGMSETRSGGTRAWRNNNPGNIRYSNFSINHGAIGEAGGFAVFPDEAMGHQTLIDLLQTSTYQGLTINQAIARYAPSFENDTNSYASSIVRQTNLNADVKLQDLTEQEISLIADAIRQIEGWRSGQVVRN